MIMRARALSIAFVGFSLLATGCIQRAGSDSAESLNGDVTGTDTDIDHDADRYVPESIAAGIEEVSQFRDEIRDAFASGNPDAAHGPLHQLPDVLDGLNILAEREISDEDELKNVTALLEKLFASFSAIDAKLHQQGGSAFADVSDDIDSALMALKSATSKTGEVPGPGSESAVDNRTTTETQE